MTEFGADRQKGSFSKYNQVAGRNVFPWTNCDEVKLLLSREPVNLIFPKDRFLFAPFLSTVAFLVMQNRPIIDRWATGRDDRTFRKKSKKIIKYPGGEGGEVEISRMTINTKPSRLAPTNLKFSASTTWTSQKNKK